MREVFSWACSYMHIDVLLSINKPRFWEIPGPYVSHWTWDQRHDREQHFWFLPRFTSVDREGGQFHTFNNDKRDDFNFYITNFPFLSSNIPASAAYAMQLSNKLFEQGYVKERLKSSLKKFDGRYGDLMKQYAVPLSQMLNDILANLINRRFSKISMCNARRCLTCHHISCKSTITTSINGNRYGIQIDKDVDWNSSNLIYVITWEARGCGA